MIGTLSLEALLTVLLIVGASYLNNYYFATIDVVVRDGTTLQLYEAKTYKNFTFNHYFCPRYCGVRHKHLVHLEKKCKESFCGHATVDSILTIISNKLK